MTRHDDHARGLCTGHRATRPPRKNAKCPSCGRPFSTDAIVRATCPDCGCVFHVRTGRVVLPGRVDE